MASKTTSLHAPVGAPLLSRRRVLVGSLALVATAVSAAAVAATPPGVVARSGGTKPTYLAQPGSTDPVAHSVAENLFWNEQMMEHAAFFVALMPGDALARERAQAERFKTIFADLLAKSSSLTRDSFRAFNQATIDQVKRYSEFEYRLRDEQAAGRLKSLVWPTFFDHTAREGDYFASRLERLSGGDTTPDQAKAAEFWTLIMGEHAGFIAHLLDPTEQALVAKAMKANEEFARMHAHPVANGKAVKAVEDILDFKTAAERGILTGEIKSIIDPALADHVRREAIKAADDLRRAA